MSPVTETCTDLSTGLVAVLQSSCAAPGPKSAPLVGAVKATTGNALQELVTSTSVEPLFWAASVTVRTRWFCPAWSATLARLTALLCTEPLATTVPPLVSEKKRPSPVQPVVVAAACWWRW